MPGLSPAASLIVFKGLIYCTSNTSLLHSSYYDTETLVIPSHWRVVRWNGNVAWDDDSASL